MQKKPVPIYMGKYFYYPQSDEIQTPFLLLDEDEEGIIKRVDYSFTNDLLSSNRQQENSAFIIELPYLIRRKSSTEVNRQEITLSPRRIELFDDNNIEVLTEKIGARYKKVGKIRRDDLKNDLLEIRYNTQSLRNMLGERYRQQFRV